MRLIDTEVTAMTTDEFKQSDYMALQLMEIEDFRLVLSRQSDGTISFQEAIMLWISEGYADEFRDDYLSIRAEREPAVA